MPLVSWRFRPDDNVLTDGQILSDPWPERTWSWENTKLSMETTLPRLAMGPGLTQSDRGLAEEHSSLPNSKVSLPDSGRNALSSTLLLRRVKGGRECAQGLGGTGRAAPPGGR